MCGAKVSDKMRERERERERETRNRLYTQSLKNGTLN